MEDAVQSLVTHLLSSSSTLPLKRPVIPAVPSTSPSPSTSNILHPKSAVTTRPQGSSTGLPASSNTHDHLIRVIRRPNTQSVSCPTVSSTANPIQPVIFNLPMGNPGGLLIVRNSQPETTVPVVSMSQPAMAHGWSQLVVQPHIGQPGSSTGNSQQLSSASHVPPSPGNLLLESPHVGGNFSATPTSVNVYQQASDNSIKSELNLCEPRLDNSAFTVSEFTTSIEPENFDSRVSISSAEESGLSQGVSELSENKSSIPCDVLEDLLHIVNESLGPVIDDETGSDTNPLQDYDLGIDDDDTGLISMVVSPDSEVPASTPGPVSDETQLSKIMDYCPEWSYVEVHYLILYLLDNVQDYNIWHEQF